MKKILNSKQVPITIKQIQGIDPAVQRISSVIMKHSYIERLSIFSVDSVKTLLLLHPIFLSKKDECYFVIAGFRSYQLAMTHLEGNYKFKATLLPDISEEEIIETATTDIMGSALMHSLGTKSVSQLEKIKNSLDKKIINKITPTLNSTRAITRFESLK